MKTELVNGFVLAAGYGKRMGPLTHTIPKPLLQACGGALVIHALFFLYQLGIHRSVLNLHYLGAQIEEKLRGVTSMDLDFSHEKEILGTAGGIRFAFEKLRGRSIVAVNPDTLLWPARRLTLNDLFEARGPAGALLMVSRREGSATGLRLHKNGTLTFEEGGPDYFVGCSLMEKSILEQMAPGSAGELGNVWRQLAESGQLRGLRFEGDVVDVGSESQYEHNRHRAVPEHIAAAWAKFREEFE